MAQGEIVWPISICAQEEVKGSLADAHNLNNQLIEPTIFHPSHYCTLFLFVMPIIIKPLITHTHTLVHFWTNRSQIILPIYLSCGELQSFGAPFK
jgi:hypothetical protein